MPKKEKTSEKATDRTLISHAAHDGTEELVDESMQL